MLGEHHINEGIAAHASTVQALGKALGNYYQRIILAQIAEEYELRYPDLAKELRNRIGNPQATEAEAFYDHLAEEVLKRLPKPAKKDKA